MMRENGGDRMTPEDLERENRAIDQTFADWMEAGKKGDVEALVSLITEDAEFWTHGAPAMKGREAATAMFQAFFAAYTYEQSFETLERTSPTAGPSCAAWNTTG